jgi:hypothetical protein
MLKMVSNIEIVASFGAKVFFINFQVNMIFLTRNLRRKWLYEFW